MEKIMTSFPKLRVDAGDERLQDGYFKRKEALIKINDLEELKKIIEQHDSKHTNDILDHFEKSLSDSYKRLGEINLQSSHLSFCLDEEENSLRLESLEIYLGELTFLSVFHFCKSDTDITLRFMDNAIFCLLSEEKVSESQKNNSKQIVSKYDDKFKVCGERQLNLRELLDEKLFITLDFVFGGDWNAIDKFCTKAIKMQIPAETPKVHQLCEEDIPF
mgnify:FL=1